VLRLTVRDRIDTSLLAFPFMPQSSDHAFTSPGAPDDPNHSEQLTNVMGWFCSLQL
jgi:hypothetical protein